MEDDVRKEYILTTASNFFLKDPREFAKKISGEKHVGRFVDDINTLILVVNKTSGEYNFTSKVSNSNNFHL